MTSFVSEDTRWNDWNRLLSRPSVFGNETGTLPNGEYEPSVELIETLHTAKVLVIGAGGLGCEILKDLALSGFQDIHIVDLDTIDISNLNRQFLFRQSDVGKGKAEVAARFVTERVPGVKVTPYNCRIQSLDEKFYRQFSVVISGLDNLEARRWLNSLLVSMVTYDEDGDIQPESIIPLIDGGTEGFKGQARVILPKITACFECTLASFPPRKAFPICTIAETPRIPEHCIAYAYLLEWERNFADKKVDTDNPEHIKWIFERASQRAAEYGIEGVTYFRTLGVVKNIIPAVASTNAVIASVCVHETVKWLTFGGQTLDNYFMYMASRGLYSNTFQYERESSCQVCADVAQPRQMKVNRKSTLQEWMDQLQEDPALQLKSPSLMATNMLFMQKPPSLKAALMPNLEKPLHQLLINGDIVNITDPALSGVSLSIQVTLV